MVKKVINFLHKEIRGLHEAAYLLGVFTLLSQILALVRDRLLASEFGAGEILDIYYAAFKVPDFIFVSVASLVSFSVLIPFLAERMEDPNQNSRKLISDVFTSFFGLIFLVSIIAFLAAPWILKLLFPGIAEGGNFGQLVLLTRIMLLQPILLGASNLFASITQIYQKFLIYAISPLLYNLGIISGIVLLYPVMGVSGLAWGVVFGALAHMLIQAPFLIRVGYFPRFNININFKEVKRVMSLSIPRTIALSSQQGSIIVLMSLASLITAGSISVFKLSFNLMNVPLAIIGASYSVAAFPTLSKLFSNGERSKFFAHIVTAARHIIFWALPVTFLFLVLRAQIVRVILGSGRFDWTDTRLTAAALGLFVLSLLSHSFMLLFTRGYYAAGITKKPVLVNVSSAVVAIFSGYVFVQLFNNFPFWKFFMEDLLRVNGIEGTAVLMLPLGYSVGMILNSLVIWFLFQRDFRNFSAALAKSFFRSLSAAIVMSFVTHLLLDVFDDVFDLQTFMGVFLQGFLAGIGGIFVGILLLRLLGSRELKEVWSSLHNKFWKSRPIVSDQVTSDKTEA